MDIPYRSYLLRIWLESDDSPVWRAMLENPNTGERHGFSSLSALFTFIQQEVERLEKDNQATKFLTYGEELP